MDVGVRATRDGVLIPHDRAMTNHAQAKLNLHRKRTESRFEK